MSSGPVTAAVESGLVIVDKPSGMTSHDVVARVRSLARTRRVGHAGTLDPMATGVLVIGVERATRLLTYLVGADKAYAATIRLGIGTVTDDREGEAVSTPGYAIDGFGATGGGGVFGGIAATDGAGVFGGGGAVGGGAVGSGAVDGIGAIEAAAAGLRGAIQQVPSSVSAIKVAGKRSYARVREGEDVVLEPRPVTVHRFDLLEARSADVDGLPVVDVEVEVVCSSGTYVRALARDLGARLGTAGHLTSLRRTRVGPYGLERAHTLEALATSFEVLPIAEAARAAFTTRALSAEEARKLAHGQRLEASELGPAPVAAYAPDGTLVALITDAGLTARPLVVLTG